MIEILLILISDQVMFTAPHIKNKWEKSNILEFLNFHQNANHLEELAFEDRHLEMIDEQKI